MPFAKPSSRWVRVMRERLSEAQNHRCAYCGVKFGAEVFAPFHGRPSSEPTIDHVRPIARGGLHEWENLVAACRRCNELRRDEMALAFYRREGWLVNRKDRKLREWLIRAIRKREPR